MGQNHTAHFTSQAVDRNRRLDPAKETMKELQGYANIKIWTRMPEHRRCVTLILNYDKDDPIHRDFRNLARDPLFSPPALPELEKFSNEEGMVGFVIATTRPQKHDSTPPSIRFGWVDFRAASVTFDKDAATLNIEADYFGDTYVFCHENFSIGGEGN